MVDGDRRFPGSSGLILARSQFLLEQLQALLHDGGSVIVKSAAEPYESGEDDR